MSEMTHGERIKFARQMRGMTKADVARVTGLRNSHISAIEDQDRGLSIRSLLLLCDALRTDPNTLLGRWGAKTEGDPPKVDTLA